MQGQHQHTRTTSQHFLTQSCAGPGVGGRWGGYTLARSQEVRLQRGNRMMMPDAGPASAWVESKPRDLRGGGHLCQG